LSFDRREKGGTERERKGVIFSRFLMNVDGRYGEEHGNGFREKGKGEKRDLKAFR
jgi:hypothetical protein